MFWMTSATDARGSQSRSKVLPFMTRTWTSTLVLSLAIDQVQASKQRRVLLNARGLQCDSLAQGLARKDELLRIGRDTLLRLDRSLEPAEVKPGLPPSINHRTTARIAAEKWFCSQVCRTHTHARTRACTRARPRGDDERDKEREVSTRVILPPRDRPGLYNMSRGAAPLRRVDVALFRKKASKGGHVLIRPPR